MISLNTLIQKRRQSGKMLVDFIYAIIDLPNDMCYEISLYLVYDTRTLEYQQRYHHLFLYKKILEDSLHLMSRHTEKVLSTWWFVRFDNDYLFCKMFCGNCLFCGNYTSAERWSPKLNCFCYKMKLEL